MQYNTREMEKRRMETGKEREITILKLIEERDGK